MTVVTKFLERVLKEKDELKRRELIDNKFIEIEDSINKLETKLEKLRDFMEALEQFHIVLRRI